MKKMLLFILVVFACPVPSQAACFPGYCKGKGANVIQSVIPLPTGGAYFDAPSADRAQLNCTLSEGYAMVLEASHPNFKEIYTTVLTALASNKELSVRIEEGSSNCRVVYVRMWSE